MSADPELSFLDGYLPYLLRRADQALSAAFYEALNQNGVPRSDWRVIAVLHELGSLSIAELTHRSLSPQPTVTHAVSRLEERGLVKRVQGKDDKRQRFVSLTKKGSTLTASLIAEAEELQRTVLDDAGVGDLTDLVTGLQKLIVGVGHPSEVGRQQGEPHHD